MALFNPPHPGEILREDVIEALGLTLSDAAKRLGLTRVQLSRVLNEHPGISTAAMDAPTVAI